jgi:hypothetical protein
MLSTILPLLYPFLALILSGLVGWVLTKVAAHFKIQVTAQEEALVSSAVNKAVAYVEQWASNKATKPTSADKLSAAVQFVIAELNQYGLPARAVSAIESLIESKLGMDAAWFGPSSAVPPTTTTHV